MKILDKIKISFKAVINSKLRALFTSLIVFIVGTLILAILLIGTNFASNLNKFQTTYMQNTETNTFISRYNYDYGGNKIYKPFYKDDINKALNFAEKYSDVVHNFELDTSSIYFNYNDYITIINSYYEYQEYFRENRTQMNIHVISFRFQGEYKLLDGTYWNQEHANTNSIWVTKSFVEKARKQGVKIYPGKDIYLSRYFTYYNSTTNQTDSFLYSDHFIIRGIVDNIIRSRKEMDIIMDFEYAINNYNVELLNTRNIKISYRAPVGKYNFNKVYTRTNNLVNGLKAVLSNEEYIIDIESELINTMKITRLLEVAIIGISVIIGSIILLLSVGSVANTIMISVDKNKKFIGLLKAIGLNQKDTIHIIQIESGIIIGTGIIIATIFVMAIKKIFINAITMLFDVFTSIFEFQTFTVNFKVPLYMPILISIGFLGLALVFSRTSLQDIAKMDPISIISEVS